jgi:kinesin family protein 4/21/27
MVQTTSNTSIAIDAPQGKKVFVFDRVFGPEVGQDGIWEYLNESVSAFLQGYNVSLLAYGQSGAGKSYTMGTSGPMEQGDLDSMGMSPFIATKATNRSELYWQFTLGDADLYCPRCYPTCCHRVIRKT